MNRRFCVYKKGNQKYAHRAHKATIPYVLNYVHLNPGKDNPLLWLTLPKIHTHAHTKHFTNRISMLTLIICGCYCFKGKTQIIELARFTVELKRTRIFQNQKPTTPPPPSTRTQQQQRQQQIHLLTGAKFLKFWTNSVVYQMNSFCFAYKSVGSKNESGIKRKATSQ